MRRSTQEVSSGEAASYDSDSKQTIPGPVGHRVEIGEAVALAASPFFTTNSLFVCCGFSRTLFSGDANFVAWANDLTRPDDRCSLDGPTKEMPTPWIHSATFVLHGFGMAYYTPK